MGYMSISPLYERAPAEPRVLPRTGIAVVGTGGVANVDYFRHLHQLRLSQMGYQAVLVLVLDKLFEPPPYVALMQEIQAGFGRTMTRLPEVFGVSRQTLYNWLKGETPRPAHQEKLEQLAEAARVFSASGFKPTSPALDRTISQGKSLLQLLSEGADGREAAQNLMRIVQRGRESRAKLDELLGGRKARLEASDIGAPSLDEDA